MRRKVEGLARKLRRPSYAEVVATLALFIALGGASYAAIQIPKNSVGTKQLKKNAVTSKKVKNRSLLAVDFRRGQLPRGATGPAGLPGTDGAVGSAGPVGATGAPGPTGAAGVTGPIGPAGVTGPIGPAGATRAAGADGSDGATGANGSIGPTGTTGATGNDGVSSSAVMNGHSYLTFFPQYFATSGVSSASAAKIGVTTISPAVPVTARNLAVRLGTAPGVGNVRAIYLTDDGSLVLGCVVGGLSTACNETSTNAVISPASELVMFSSTGGLPVDSEIDFAFTIGP